MDRERLLSSKDCKKGKEQCIQSIWISLKNKHIYKYITISMIKNKFLNASTIRIWARARKMRGHVLKSSLHIFNQSTNILLIFQYSYHLFYYPATKVHNWSDETMTSKCKYLGNQESFKIKFVVLSQTMTFENIPI